MTKEELIALIAACADSSGDLDVKRALGDAAGSDFQLRGETVSPGIGYTIPGSLNCILEGIASALGNPQPSSTIQLFDDFHTLNMIYAEDMEGGAIYDPVQTTWVCERSAEVEWGQAKATLYPAEIFPASESGSGLLALETVTTNNFVRFMDGTPTINGASDFTFEARVRTGRGSLVNFEIGLVGVDGVTTIRQQGATWLCKTANSVSYTNDGIGSYAIPAYTWAVIRIIKTATEVNFYINDILKSTITTTIPDSSSSLGRYIYMQDTAITSFNSVMIDYINVTASRLTGTTSGMPTGWSNPHIHY